jgi:hypothetical protein
MKFISTFLIFFLIQFFLPFQSQAQTSVFPKIGYGQIDLNDWNAWVYVNGLKRIKPLDKYKHPLFFVGGGIEQKFTKNFKIILSTSYSSKVSHIQTTPNSWVYSESETQYRLLTSDLSFYYKVFSNFSLGGGINHLKLRNFKYPDENYEEHRKELESQAYNYWGYHFGINYDWKSLGFLLQYSRTNISKEDLAKEYTYPAQKFSLLTFSILYKFKLGKLKKKGEGCPTF